MNAGTRIALALLLAWPLPARAQTFLERFSYEGLRLSGVGIELGGVISNRLTTAVSPALRVDYGYIAPHLRVLFGAAYFRGNFSDREISRFEQRIAGLVTDPNGGFVVNVGQITLTDVEADLSLQYVGRVTPGLAVYGGGGVGVHVRNGSGAAIDDTFVEDALDTITAGFTGSVGVEAAVTGPLWLTADVRGGLTSELRTASARGGVMLRWSGARR